MSPSQCWISLILCDRLAVFLFAYISTLNVSISGGCCSHLLFMYDCMESSVYIKQFQSVQCLNESVMHQCLMYYFSVAGFSGASAYFSHAALRQVYLHIAKMIPLMKCRLICLTVAEIQTSSRDKLCRCQINLFICLSSVHECIAVLVRLTWQESLG